MSSFASESELIRAMQRAIEDAIPGAVVQVRSGGGGHFSVSVSAAAFEGQRSLQKQRMVYAALAPFMAGDGAPVHAIDSLETTAP